MSSTVQFSLQTQSPSQAAAWSGDLLIYLISKAALNEKMPADALSTFAKEAYEAGDFDGSASAVLHAYRHGGIKAPRVMLLGIGEGAANDVGKALTAALAAYKAAQSSKNKKTNSAAMLLWAQTPAPASLQAAMQAAAASFYKYKTTKSDEESAGAAPKKRANAVSQKAALQSILLAAPQAAELQEAFKLSQASIAGMELAKEWGNRPANHATPSMLAEAAKQLAKSSAKISCEVMSEREVRRLKMGAFLAVAQGSIEPLKFITLKYSGAVFGRAPTVLVGKGITFDTGGISIKPAPEMDEMKFDMCGAASVLGVFQALAILQPKINVIGLIPSCENMPSGSAVKPGDVVTSMSGQTIEILNTDAEGRLILCDALTYSERFKPAAVVDIATLTGACVIALGAVRSGLFSSSDDLAAQLLAAGEKSRDLAWRMPLDDEYAEGLKSNFADVANVAGRAGGSITAAKFLQRFSKAFPWAHLDIAGTAWKSGAAKGSTGRPVALLLQFLLDFVPISDAKPSKIPVDHAGTAPKKRAFGKSK